MAPDLIVGQWYPAGTFVESYRGYDLYISRGGYFETGNLAADASMEIRPAFDNTTWEYRTGARQHIDEHCAITGTCPSQNVTVTMGVSPSGSGTILTNGQNISSITVASGTSVTWQANPSSGWKFDHFVGASGNTTTLNPFTTTVTVNGSVTAVFIQSTSATYSCINNICTQYTCTPGTANCYTTSNCNLACTAPPPTQCPSGQMSIFGSCTPTIYIVAGGVGLLMLMLLKKK